MLAFLRKIRNKQIKEKQLGNYVLYAVGEIILVVVGILIAISIDNNNETKKERTKELHYLQNIKTDLHINILEIDKYVEIRTQCIEGANRILEYFEGKPLTDLAAFNADAMPIYSWQRFHQNNNTYQELINSGNLALFKNDSIKKMLFNIELKYKVMKAEEDHFRYDTELNIYEPVYALMDINTIVKNFAYRVSNGQAGENRDLSKEKFDKYLKNINIKNGFALTTLEFTTLNEMLNHIKQMSEQLIILIDKEIAKG